jgi:hypothetical protein
MEVLNPLMANTLGPSLINNESVNTIQDARLRTPQIPSLNSGSLMQNPGLGLQQPRPGMGLGFPGMKSLEEGMLFIPDKENPRSEEEIQAMYKKAQDDAAKQRREGFLGQVMLPGEYSYEHFKANNLFGFKRNPNLPDSAYDNFDLTGVSGFDDSRPTAPIDPRGPTINDPTAPPFLGRPSLENLPNFKGPPGLPPPSQLPPVGINNLLGKVEGGIGAMNPYDNQFNFNDRSSLNSFVNNMINNRLKQFFGGIMDMLDV